MRESLSTSRGAAPSATSVVRTPSSKKSIAPRVCARVRGVNVSMDDEAMVEAAKSDPTAMVHLLRHKRGLVLAVANRYKRLPQQEEDDLIQLGLIGLVQAARTYDPARHPSFSTHATLLIRREMDHRSVRPMARRAAAGVRVVSFQAAPPSDAGDDLSLDTRPWLAGAHPESTEPDPDFERDTLVRLRHGPRPRLRPRKADAHRRIISADLTPRQREVLLQRLDGKLQRELGTQQVVAKIERAAIRKILQCPPSTTPDTSET